jgi:hypothetical protein
MVGIRTSNVDQGIPMAIGTNDEVRTDLSMRKLPLTSTIDHGLITNNIYTISFELMKLVRFLLLTLFNT